MRRELKIVVLACAIVFPSGASGQVSNSDTVTTPEISQSRSRWTLVHEDNEKRISFDVIGVRQTFGAIWEVWERWEFAEPQSSPSGRGTYDHDLRLKLYDCEGRSSALMELAAYSRSGQTVGSFSNATPEWRRVIPDTVGESLWEFMCRS